MIGDQALQGYLGRLPIHEVAAWKQGLEHHRSDCGCRVSAMVMLAGMAAWIVYAVLEPSAELSWRRTTVGGLIVLLASGLVGKLLGLGLARMRFHLMVRRLRRRACSAGA